MRKTFKVSTKHSGRLRTVKVVVHDTQEEMVRQATQYEKKVSGSTQANFSQLTALAQCLRGRYTKYKTNRDGLKVRLPDAGVIRFYADGIDTEVITHEVSHIALCIYQLDCYAMIGDPVRFMKNEEILCYLIGDLSLKVTGKLYKIGYKDRSNK